MKKSIILLLLSFVFLSFNIRENKYSDKVNTPDSEKEKGKDHPIEGKWEYEKTILPDGSEVIDLIATEHFYSNGTFLAVNVWLEPQSINEFTNSPEEIKNNFKNASGVIGTYKIEKGLGKDKFIYSMNSSTSIDQMGNTGTVSIKVDKDTFIYYFKNGNQIIMRRVKDK